LAGFRLLPIVDIVRKTPPGGFKWGERASSDFATVQGFLRSWPWAYFAVALSAEMVVVDLDVKDDRNGFAEFERRAGKHPDEIDTIQATTPSHGRHLFFDRDGHRFGNCSGDNAKQRGHPGLETKTLGGYVLVPPAPGRHWLAGKRTMAPAPAWLKELFPIRKPPPVAPAKTTTTTTIWGMSLLLRMYRRIAEADIGCRDNTANQSAFITAQYVAGGDISDEDARDWIRKAIWDQSAVGQKFSKEKYFARVMKSGYQKGLTQPRSRETDLRSEEALERALDEAGELDLDDGEAQS
jgi:hypothetical protein